jgi:hypothetical protein
MGRRGLFVRPQPSARAVSEPFFGFLETSHREIQKTRKLDMSLAAVALGDIRRDTAGCAADLIDQLKIAPRGWKLDESRDLISKFFRKLPNNQILKNRHEGWWSMSRATSLPSRPTPEVADFSTLDLVRSCISCHSRPRLPGTLFTLFTPLPAYL